MNDLFVFLSGGEKGQRGRQIADMKNQMEDLEVVGQEELEEDIATLPQQFEDLSVTVTGGSFG